MADEVKCASKSKKSMKWNIEQETLLINLVKSHEHLWDVKNNLYLNRTLKRTTYSEIAQVLIEAFPESAGIFTVDEVMTKFSNLRTYFRTKYNQFKQPSGSGSVGIVPRWEHFFSLQFLGESLKPTKSLSNLETSIVEDENAADPNLNESDTSINVGSSATELQSPEATELQSPGVKKSNRKRKRKPSDEIRQFALETLEELKNKEEGEDEIYGQYIAKVLKSFDPVKKDLCKLEFQNVILKLRHNVHLE